MLMEVNGSHIKSMRLRCNFLSSYTKIEAGYKASKIGTCRHWLYAMLCVVFYYSFIEYFFIIFFIDAIALSVIEPVLMNLSDVCKNGGIIVFLPFL